MDLLFKRYASPFVLCDQYISSCRFSEFVDKIICLHNTETKEKMQWEYFLHKVFDKSYAQYLETIEHEEAEDDHEEVDFGTTVYESMNILKDFQKG